MIDPEMLGIVSIIIMVGSYALESRSSIFVATFAFGCALAAFYAYLIGSIPFLVAEGLWAIIAARRWYLTRGRNSQVK